MLDQLESCRDRLDALMLSLHGNSSKDINELIEEVNLLKFSIVVLYYEHNKGQDVAFKVSGLANRIKDLDERAFLALIALWS